MFQIILLFLALLFLKKPSNILCCGIWAWTGDDVRKFNWDKFNIQGLFNNSRGGDSCGRLVNGKRTVGIDKKKSYFEFIGNIEAYPEVLEKTVLGHARKASVGFINEANAMPIVLTEEDQVKYALIHNGTIFNIDALASEFGVANNNLTDSQILARILRNKDYEVLSKYEGGTALVAYDRELFITEGRNVIYVFKGASKGYQKDIVEERPLYLYSPEEGSMYISSVAEGLLAIGGDYPEIIDVDTNVLFTIEDGEISDVKEIDRSKASSIKVYKNTYVDSTIDITKESIPISYSTTKIVYAKTRYYIGISDSQKLMDGMYYITRYGDAYITPPINQESIVGWFHEGAWIKSEEAYVELCTEFYQLEQGEREGYKGFNIILKYSRFPLASLSTREYSRYIRIQKEDKTYSEFFTGDLKADFSSKAYTVLMGDVSKISYNNAIPSYLFDKPETNKNTSLMLVGAETSYEEKEDNIYAIEETDNILDLIFKEDNMIEKFAEQEAAEVLYELLDKTSKAIDILKALSSDSPIVSKLSENLSIIDKIICDESFGKASVEYSFK